MVWELSVRPASSASRETKTLCGLDMERRDLVVPAYSSPQRDSGEIRHVAIEGDTLSAEPDIAINRDACITENANGRDAIVKIGHTSQIGNVAAVEALGPAAVIRIFIHANAFTYV